MNDPNPRVFDPDRMVAASEPFDVDEFVRVIHEGRSVPGSIGSPRTGTRLTMHRLDPCGGGAWAPAVRADTEEGGIETRLYGWLADTLR